MGAARIMVVDDEADFRVQVRRALERDGYVVDEAADGAEALERLRAGHFDLAIVDLLMPRVTGLRLLAELRADRRKAPPAIILTAFGDWGSYTQALDLGAVAFLAKPLGMVDLLREVARALASPSGAGPGARGAAGGRR